jgi:hypothetical protein
MPGAAKRNPTIRPARAAGLRLRLRPTYRFHHCQNLRLGELACRTAFLECFAALAMTRYRPRLEAVGLRLRLHPTYVLLPAASDGQSGTPSTGVPASLRRARMTRA